MRPKLWIVLLTLVISGCNTHRDSSSDEDQKQVLWCVGACLFGHNRNEGKETKADIETKEEEEDEPSNQ